MSRIVLPYSDDLEVFEFPDQTKIDLCNGAIHTLALTGVEGYLRLFISNFIFSNGERFKFDKENREGKYYSDHMIPKRALNKIRSV